MLVEFSCRPAPEGIKKNDLKNNRIERGDNEPKNCLKFSQGNSLLPLHIECTKCPWKILLVTVNAVTRAYSTFLKIISTRLSEELQLHPKNFYYENLGVLYSRPSSLEDVDPWYHLKIQCQISEKL